MTSCWPAWSGRSDRRSSILDDDVFELQHGRSGGRLHARAEADHAAEHHLDQPVGAVRRDGFAGEAAAAQDRDSMTQALDIFKLMGDEKDRAALLAQLLQGGKESLLLQRTDPGRRFIQDQDSRTQPEQPHQFELLPFADGQRFDVGFRVEVEPEAVADFFQRRPGLGAAREQSTLAAEQEVVHDPHGWDVERVLMEHTDPQAAGILRRVNPDRLPVEQDLPAVRPLEAGQDLHQCALAGAVFSQDSLDRPARHRQADAVVGQDRAEGLVDIAQFDSHGIRESEGGSKLPPSPSRRRYSATLWPSIPSRS
jgi:hypothetical protein